MLDAEALADLIAEIVSEEVEKATNPLLGRIAELEARPCGAMMDDVKGVVEVMISDALVLKAPRNGTDGKDGRDGKDAAGIVQALKDSGELVLTLEDGRLIRTGIRDGEKGLDGKDGRDGFGFEDMDACVLDDDRTIELSFRKGDEEKAFTFKWPTVIYRGVYKEAAEYDAGDCVTWGGHAWIAERKPDGKPDQPEKGWRLAVKRGQRGPAANG